jgi:hypothetical protein
MLSHGAIFLLYSHQETIFALFPYTSACPDSTFTCSGCIYPQSVPGLLLFPSYPADHPHRQAQTDHYYTWPQSIQTMPHTSAPLALALDDCYRKLGQSLRDLEDHTARIKAETLRLKAAIRHMEDTIPRENEHENRHHQVHVRHVNQVQLIKSIVFHTSTKIANLRSHLRRDEEDILRAVNRVIGRLAGEMPSWGRNFSWMMQHLP